MKFTKLWLLWMLLVSVVTYGQTTVQKTITRTVTVEVDTNVASKEWVREYIQRFKFTPVPPTEQVPQIKNPPTGSVPAIILPPTLSETPTVNQQVKYIVNGTGKSIDFNDPDGISPNVKQRIKLFVQGENGVDAVRLVFNWGDYNPSQGVYKNEGLTRAIAWVQSLRPNNPPKIRLLFVPILQGNDGRIPREEIQVDANGNLMDCTYNSLFTTVPSYYSFKAMAMLNDCYDALIPFLAQNYANDIEVLELAAGQSEEHGLPYTAQGAGSDCGTYSGIGDYSVCARNAFKMQYGHDLPNVGVTQGYNWNMNYSDVHYRNAALFWGKGVFDVWDRFRAKVKQHSSFAVGVVVADLLNDQGAKWVFHGFALPKMIEKCDYFYHTYNLSSSEWHGNLLGTDLLEGTRPNQIISEIEYDPHDCGTNNGFGPIDEAFCEQSLSKIIQHGAKGIHFSMDWDEGQILAWKRVMGKVKAKNLQPISRTKAPTIEVKASEIFNSSYFLDQAWRSLGNKTSLPFEAKPVNIRLINDLF